MNRDEAAELFFSLCDAAEAAVLRDPLRERVAPGEWRIEREKTVTVSDELMAVVEGRAAANGEAPSAPGAPRPAACAATLNDMLLDCHDCGCWMNRDDRVRVGDGALRPLFLFVFDRVRPDGSWTGKAEEDFLSKWISALKLDRRRECHFTSVIKCPSEGYSISAGCEEILRAQVGALKPKVVVMLGSAGCLLVTGSPDIEAARGRVHEWNGAKTICTYSPSQLIDNYQALRRPIWDDLRAAAGVAGTSGRLG